jgi:tRNA threonylcarbamoyladenosine biosynthesis protein TsaE
MARYILISHNLEETLAIGRSLAQVLKGGELLELSSDLGGGKTSFVKGLASGMGCHETVQSPSFTISRVYECENGLELQHFDFYRLTDAGIMGAELAESVADPLIVVVIEWAGIVEGILPTERIRLEITIVDETVRQFTITVPEKYSELNALLKDMEKNYA